MLPDFYVENLIGEIYFSNSWRHFTEGLISNSGWPTGPLKICFARKMLGQCLNSDYTWWKMIFDIKIACGGARAFPCEGRGGAGYTRTMFCSCFIHVARHRAVPPVKRDHLPGQCETEWCCLRHSLVVQSPNSSPSPYPGLREVQLPRTHDPEMTLNLCPCWCCLATPALTPTGLLSSQSHTLPQVCNADLLDIRDLRSPDSTGRLLIFLSGVVNLSTAKVLITCCAFFPKPI